MPAAPVPRMHGLTHVPGGPDPIPGLVFPSGGGFPDFETGVLSLSSLRGYWRLGDGASPFADTAGDFQGPFDMVKHTGSVAMTDSVTGGLPVDQDDGAVQFNATAGGSADYLHSPDSGPPRRFNFFGESFTLCAFVNPTASASSFDGLVISNWIETTGFSGWRLGVRWPTRIAFFTRKEDGGSSREILSPGGLVPAEWTFLAATYDDDTGLHCLYVDGALVASATDTSVINLPTANLGPNIGGRGNLISQPLSFCGGIDEVAVWGRALTADEIAALFTAGTAPDTAMPAGKVLTSDGDGGSSYQWPTVKVDGTRYDEILTGTNLTSTDNSDGTVTLDATGGGSSDPADDTLVWMPLFDSDGSVVLDSDEGLIPTLIPIA